MELKKTDFLKIPNLLSILRILMLIPLILLIKNEKNLWFFAFALIAVATDWFDGYLARKLNQITELGKILDPIADKLNTAGILLALNIYQDFPIWIVIIIVGRDIFILIGALFILKQKKYVTPSNMPGKLAMFFIALSIILYILDQTILFEYALFITIFFIIISFLIYLRVFILNYSGKILNEKRS
jgi:CDP-diacylglycerol--glycerol-3-phosphate 3-phosphatidyltransferase